MYKSGMTYAEYCQIIESEIKSLRIKERRLNEKKQIYAKCCRLNKDVVFLGVEKIRELFKTNEGKKQFEKILKCVFGENFFDDMTLDEKKEYQSKGLFIKDNLDEILGTVYGNKYGYNFERPNSWQDMVLFINNVLNVYNNVLLNDAVKEQFFILLFSLNKVIEKAYAKTIVSAREISFVINMYNEFLSAVNEKRNVKIDDNSCSLIKNILNKDGRSFVLLEEKEEKKIGFGDAFILFCESYNSDIKKAQESTVENKKQLKTKKRIDTYYNNIKNTSFEDLSNKNFPRYYNNDYVQIIKGLIDRFIQDLNEDEKWLPYYTITQMHYASYFKTRYYDEEKVFGKRVN